MKKVDMDKARIKIYENSSFMERQMIDFNTILEYYVLS